MLRMASVHSVIPYVHMPCIFLLFMHINIGKWYKIEEFYQLVQEGWKVPPSLYRGNKLDLTHQLGTGITVRAWAR